ncbi:MAG: glycosyltransferase [bacterium]
MIYIVLPAYNEAEALPELFRRLRGLDERLGEEWKVLVVNDGSADGTRDAALGHPLAADGRVIVVDHPRNMGLARAMSTGIDAFLERSAGDDVMVSMDADDTHDPSHIPDMVDRVRRGADVVIASRFAPGGGEIGVSPPRRILSRGAVLFMRLFAGVPGVRDYTCGFRAYSRRILRESRRAFGANLIETGGFSVMAELLVRMNPLGARVEEIPFVLHYERKRGRSKIRFARTIAGYAKIAALARSLRRRRNERETAGNPPDGRTAHPRCKVAVLVATYNEKENIEALVPQIFSTVPEASVVVVDDNSPDGTGAAVERMKADFPNLHLIRRAGKSGYGTAFIAGLQWARARGFDAVLSMDADFSHDPEALPGLLAAGERHPVVVGSRYVPGGRTVNWSLRRRILSRGGNLFARTLLGIPVRDVTTGYRFLDLNAVAPARLECVSAKGYGFLVETMFRIVSAGIRPAEFPITFTDRKIGKSKMSGNIIAEAFFLVLKLWLGKTSGRIKRI